MSAMHRSAQGLKASREDLYANFPEPDPDYIDDDDNSGQPSEEANSFPPPPPPLTAEQLSEAVSEAYDLHVQNGDTVAADMGSSAQTPPLIAPKPLTNPCVESKERQALHRELVLNYKIGKDVLQKPELNKVLRERRETQRKKEWEEQKSHKGRTSLEMKLEERATRMKEEEQESLNVIKEERDAPEFVRMHRKITLKPGGQPDQS